MLLTFARVCVVLCIALKGRDQEVTSQFVNDQSGSYAEIQASTEHYHEYHGGASSWQPPSYQEVRRVQFKYPQWRPDEDTKEA